MSLARLANSSTSKDGRVPTGKASEVVISESSFRAAHRAHEAQDGPAGKKRKREERGDASIVYGAGAYKGPWARYEEHRPDASGESHSSGDEEVEEVEYVYEEDQIETRPAAPTDKAGTAYEETGDGRETSEFHGREEFDYQGRTYMHVPQDLDIDLRRDNAYSERRCYVPKKQVHVWKSHTKPITQMRFFPDSGHLLLSASHDSKVKIWDVYHQRELLRTYSGHTRAVSDIDFAPDGTRFLSGGYDKQMKLWDTETGACISRFSTGATPHVLRINEAMPHEFLAGMSDKKIVQFDVRAPTGASASAGSGALAGTGTGAAKAKPVQEYDYHLGPVNTITFCDGSRRFMTTSDDKSLRAWEYGIPVPIKFVAEPHMFAMTRSCLHPSGNSAAFQSADNQIVVYAAGDKFRQNRKKAFRGHNNAGYAIDVQISPDGSIVASGDSAGYVCFWDWKTCKMWHKILTAGADGGACTALAWHPREPSKVVTGGLGGELRYWD